MAERPLALKRYRAGTIESPTESYNGSPCHVWTGRKHQGYGVFIIGGRPVRIHRWAYERFVGPIPAGKQLDHLCHDPALCEGGHGCPHRSCSNVEHLQPVTIRQNVLRGNGLAARNKSKVECPQGHRYDEANTIIVKSTGERRCRECHKAQQRAQYAKSIGTPAWRERVAKNVERKRRRREATRAAAAPARS